MKKVSKILIFTLLSSLALVGCNDLLDVDSNRNVFTDDYKMTAANDTLYSMFGIFSQLEKIADSYVLLGELRGDLMQVTDQSSMYLKEINNFNISTNNPYANNLKDYYSVINNCNYVIHNIDTSVVKNTKKVMLKEYAACKAIRAWSFIQIALNYGSVVYYDKPILTLKDAEAIQLEQPKTLEQLAEVLIADLIPLKDIDEPNLGSLYSYNTTYSYFPIRFLLGDLYLWTGQYEYAATEYHDLMYRSKYILSSNYKSTRTVTNGAFTTNVNWTDYINLTSENVTNIAASNVYGHYFDLDSLTLNRMIAPTSVAINNWDSQKYFYSAKLDTLGDLRKLSAVSKSLNYSSSNNITPTSNYFLYKYILLNPILDKKATAKLITPYRVPLLYLRYAEAVNRSHKPNLAFAVLKNGLTKSTLANKKIVPQNEITDNMPGYMNFTDARFDSNIGVRMRGLGNINADTTYVIPNLNTLQDSVVYVEDLIEKELALETAFEGNRFHDLMRFAIRRNDNSYLADRVAAKYTTNKEAIRSKLTLNRDYWYLKK